MKLSDFIRSKWLYITTAAASAVFSFALLSSLGLGAYAAGYLCALFLLGLGAALAAEFRQKRQFYHTLEANLDRLDKKYLLSQITEEPDFLEGKILFHTLQQTNKAMNDEIARYRLEVREYREYVESWVHEVKTPISACRLILENNPGKLSRSLSHDFGRIEEYVEQALFYARSGGVEKDYILRRCMLRDLVDSTLSKNAALLVECGARVAFDGLDLLVMADGKWMDFIIGQVIMNSVKYRRGNLLLKFSGSRAGSSVTLVLQDNGAGIPQQDLGRVFEKGFTGENGRSGAVRSTGIGLYLCRRLCEKMGLGISVTSQVGKGTAVSIVFPVDERTAILTQP